MRAAAAWTDRRPPSILAGTGASLNVVVHTEDGLSTGFVVDELLDIVDERFVIEEKVGRATGVLGTAVIQQKVTRVLDLAQVREHAR